MALQWRLYTLLEDARDKSPFYRRLYSRYSIDENVKLQDVPLIDHASYWAAYSSSEREVMTGRQSDGILMKTGGTTSTPKFTAYSQAELLRTANLLARGLMRAGLCAGDRVGNLFYAGDLYGSFLLHILSVISLPIPAVQVPIGGLCAPEVTADLLDRCRVTVVLSTVTSLMLLEEHCRPRAKQFGAVNAVMFSGEPYFPDQERALNYLFPNAAVRSCIYGSIDAGVIATCVEGSSDHHEHQLFAEAVVAEIIQDDGTPTLEEGISGNLVVTNLLRELSPIIRYPTGDRAEWVDSTKGKIRLKGRAETSVRLGPVSLDFKHLREITQQAIAPIKVSALQLILTRESNKDCLELAIVPSPGFSDTHANDSILRALERERPMYKQHVDIGLIMPIKITWKTMSQMHVSTRSGKLPQILDQRT